MKIHSIKRSVVLMVSLMVLISYQGLAQTEGRKETKTPSIKQEEEYQKDRSEYLELIKERFFCH